MALLFNDQEIEKVCQVLQRLDATAYLAIDTETTGLHPYTKDVIRGISLAWANSAVYIPLSHPNSQNISETSKRLLVKALEQTAAKHVFHNAVYDWAFLEQIGLSPRPDYFDTYVAAWLINENEPKALKEQGAKYFGINAKDEQLALKKLMKGKTQAELYKELRAKGMAVTIAREESKRLSQESKKTWGTFTAEDIADYACQDARLTLALCRQQIFENRTLMGKPLQRELKVQSTLYRMIKSGVAIDVERVRSLREQYLYEIQQIEEEFSGLNLNSSQQLSKLLYEDWGLPVKSKTATDKPSTNHDALVALKPLHEGIGKILRHRELTKAVSSYLDALLELKDSNDRIHSHINMCGTVTGRFSSSEPNLQNIPRDTTNPEIKMCFTATPGYELWEFDLVSAELFVGASVAGDLDMLKVLQSGSDLHTETAIRMFGNTDGGNRTLAKNLNYGIPYGIGPKKAVTYIAKAADRAALPGDYDEAKEMLKRHKQAWPRTHNYINEVTKFVEQNGYIDILPHIWPGRTRHFPAITDGVYDKPYRAFNCIVQGGVAELVKEIMFSFEEEMFNFDGKMVLQLHDAIWLELKEDSGDQVAYKIQEITDRLNPYIGKLRWEQKRIGSNVLI